MTTINFKQIKEKVQEQSKHLELALGIANTIILANAIAIMSNDTFSCEKTITAFLRVPSENPEEVMEAVIDLYNNLIDEFSSQEDAPVILAKILCSCSEYPQNYTIIERFAIWMAMMALNGTKFDF